MRIASRTTNVNTASTETKNVMALSIRAIGVSLGFPMVFEGFLRTSVFLFEVSEVFSLELSLKIVFSCAHIVAAQLFEACRLGGCHGASAVSWVINIRTVQIL